MKISTVSIGFFVIGGLLLFGIGMFVIGDRHQAFARHSEYYSEFVNLAGLAKGAKVRVAGMDAGQVLAIDVPDSPSSRFRVKWRIDAKLRGLVRGDSVATIGTEGIVGGTYLSVKPGSPQAPEASELATIPSKETSDLSELLARGNGLLTDADGILKEVGGRLNGTLDVAKTTISNANDVIVGIKQGRGTAGMLLTDNELAERIRQTVNTTTADVQEIIADLKAGRGPAGVILRDEAVAGQIRDAVANGKLAAVNLAHASQQADSLVTDLNSRQIPQKAGEVMDNLNDSSRQVHQLIADLNKPDQYGMTVTTNIRQTLTNANTASGNLADDSEALKHNFLTRGFFKKRGYYNLAEMSPEEYRKQRAFTDPANRRVWLSGSELFQKSSNGEELSPNGKELLNAALTQNGDPMTVDPIVIEGYRDGGASADQLRLSRSRAMIVRQYLQDHFQLDPRNMGVVSLKNAPPKGTEHVKWDGICIVVLRKG
jgi:phospholipid/cholesterol/gamma-HCH transport system substrate-binding protein